MKDLLAENRNFGKSISESTLEVAKKST